MRREVEQRLILPSFACDASEFEAFLQRLESELFGAVETFVRVSIDLPGEEITFEEISDLREN